MRKKKSEFGRILGGKSPYAYRDGVMPDRTEVFWGTEWIGDLWSTGTVDSGRYKHWRFRIAWADKPRWQDAFAPKTPHAALTRAKATAALHAAWAAEARRTEQELAEYAALLAANPKLAPWQPTLPAPAEAAVEQLAEAAAA